MFEKVKECLDEFETTFQKVDKTCSWDSDEADILEYFELNLAKAIIQDGYINSEKVAKIIFAAKDLSNEVIVKVE